MLLHSCEIINCPKGIVNIIRLIPIFLFITITIPLPSIAGEIDGSKPLYGTVDRILEINQFKINDNVDPNIVGLPQNFVIDFKARLIRPSKDSMVRKTSKIRHIVHLENKLILQGVEDGVENVDDGLVWSIVISKKTGKMVLSAAGDGVAYLGTIVPHWRSPLRTHENDRFMQLFLHFVRKNGQYADYAYDRNEKCFELLTR